MSVLLEANRLTAGYDGVPVVRDLDLTVSSGEIVALLGANGAGKTTTLRTISGLLPPISGEVVVDGHDLRGTPPHKMARSGVVYVPEDRALFHSLTVRENLRLRGPAAVESAVDRFPPLSSLLDRRVGLLSGGEQQMLALGRALGARLRLLLVDEMSLGLAPVIVESLIPALREAADRHGVGVLVVEQHVHLALELADRAYVLSHGELAIEGDAELLARDPDVLASSYLGDRAMDGVSADLHLAASDAERERQL